MPLDTQWHERETAARSSTLLPSVSGRGFRNLATGGTQNIEPIHDIDSAHRNDPSRCNQSSNRSMMKSATFRSASVNSSHRGSMSNDRRMSCNLCATCSISGGEGSNASSSSKSPKSLMGSFRIQPFPHTVESGSFDHGFIRIGTQRFDTSTGVSGTRGSGNVSNRYLYPRNDPVDNTRFL